MNSAIRMMMIPTSVAHASCGFLLTHSLHAVDLKAIPSWFMVIASLYFVSLIPLFITWATSGWQVFKARPVFSVLIATLIIFSFTGVWYMYIEGQLLLYELRPGVRLFWSTTSTLAMITLLAPWIARPLYLRARRLRIHAHRHPHRYALLCAALITAGSSGMAYGPLGSMPHVGDGLSYIIQGRIYMAGELHTSELSTPYLIRPTVAFRGEPEAMYVKYPPGWPFLLGLTDRVHLAWMTNALLAGLLVYLTHLLAMKLLDRRLSFWACTFLLLTPWLYLVASTWLSHLLTACLMLGFLISYLHMTRHDHPKFLWSLIHCMIAGLCLVCCIFTRAQDALFFILPLIPFGIWMMIRHPKTQIIPHLGLGCISALGAYAFLQFNSSVTGGGGQSTYGGAYSKEFASHSIAQAQDWFVWAQQSWALLNQHWFANALPLSITLGFACLIGIYRFRHMLLPMACFSSFFFAYTIIKFIGRAWIGPRWLIPMIPFVILLMAAAMIGPRFKWKSPKLTLKIRQLLLFTMIISTITGFSIMIPELYRTPPHSVNRSIIEAEKKAGLKNAIVGIPGIAYAEELEQPYLDPRHAIWTNQYPFKNSNVIYVRTIDQWVDSAEEIWPGRKILLLRIHRGEITFEPVKKEKIAPPATQPK